VRVLPHERRSDSLERLDAALFAALGLVAVIARLDALLQRHGRPQASSVARTPATGAQGDEGILMALVGLVALRRTCRAHLDALTADGRARRKASSPSAAKWTPPALGPQSSRGLLR
jgi:hypothetical protein